MPIVEAETLLYVWKTKIRIPKVKLINTLSSSPIKYLPLGKEGSSKQNHCQRLSTGNNFIKASIFPNTICVKFSNLFKSCSETGSYLWALTA